MAEGDGPLEHVALVGGGVGLGYAQQFAQIGHKALRGGQFAGGDAGPSRDEGGCVSGVAWCGVDLCVHCFFFNSCLSSIHKG